jgi:hypothetical protein
MLPNAGSKLDQRHEVIAAQASALPAGTWPEVWREPRGCPPEDSAGTINRSDVMKGFSIKGSFKLFCLSAHGQAQSLGYGGQRDSRQPSIALLPIPII